MDKELLIFDTDIGGDCDDAGALALCHMLCDKGEAQLLAVTSCYATDWVAGCIDAINKYYGCRVPIGVNYDRYVEAPNYGGGYKGYDRAICENFPNDYSGAVKAPGCLDVLRSTLAAANDGSITLVATGYLSSLAGLVLSEPDDISPLNGRELVRRKVKRTIVMGGRFYEGWPGEFLYAGVPVVCEYNINCDIKAAQTVCDNWCGELIFSSFEIGASCITLKDFHKYADVNPAARAYAEHPTAAVMGRESWDLTAVLYAIRHDYGYWRLSAPGTVSVTDDGVTHFTASDCGEHRFLLPSADNAMLCQIMDDLVMDKLL